MILIDNLSTLVDEIKTTLAYHQGFELNNHLNEPRQNFVMWTFRYPIKSDR